MFADTYMPSNGGKDVRNRPAKKELFVSIKIAEASMMR